MAKKLPELPSCKGKDLRNSAALKSKLNLSSLFPTFSCMLSTILSSDKKKEEVSASFLSYLFVSLRRSFTFSQLRVHSAVNFWCFYLICDNFCCVFLLLSMPMFIVCHQSLFENRCRTLIQLLAQFI